MVPANYYGMSIFPLIADHFDIRRTRWLNKDDFETSRHPGPPAKDLPKSIIEAGKIPLFTEFLFLQAWENYKPDGERYSIEEGVIMEKSEPDILNTKEAPQWLNL